MHKKIAIILPSYLPVPAVKGGAIESTIELIVKENEKFNELSLTVFSTYDKQAKFLAQKFKKTKFVWIKKNYIYNFLDIVLRTVRKFFNKSIDRMDSQILKRLILRDNFDKVVIHGSSGHLKALSKVVPKEKIIFYIHANIFSKKTNKNKILGKMAGLYVTVSNFVKLEIQKNALVDGDRVKIIKNPIDFETFFQKPVSQNEAYAIRAKYKIKDDDVVLLFVGRIVPEKGIKELLLALRRCLKKNQFQPFKLLVVGSFGSNFGAKNDENTFSIEIKKLAASMEDRIIFTGFVHNSMLYKLHSVVDIALMPSLCEESAGKVAIEAMVSGIPVITTNAGGITEYVPAEAGIILERDEDFIENLAKSIETLMQNKTLRETMGKRGSEISKVFNPTRFYNDYVKLVSE